MKNLSRIGVKDKCRAKDAKTQDFVTFLCQYSRKIIFAVFRNQLVLLLLQMSDCDR
jgi:hypothetical protein